MKMNRLFPLLVLVLFGGVARAHAQSEFAANLSGGQEVPPVATSAFGSATFDVNFSEGSLGVNFHLSATNLKQAFMAHIHCGAAGVNGPIIVWLAGRPGGPANAGYNLNGPWIGSAELTDINVIAGTQCTNPAGAPVLVNDLIDVLTLMFQGMTYVNIHTSAHGGGEIRGPIAAVAPFSVP
jgi:hypothetical protein